MEEIAATISRVDVQARGGNMVLIYRRENRHGDVSKSIEIVVL